MKWLVMKILALLFFFVPVLLLSQEDNRIRFGLYGGLGINAHTADFKKLPDCPSCSPGYRNGSGLGFNFGIVADYQIFNNVFVSSKFLYQDISAKLIRTEKTSIIAEGNIQEGEFEHSLDATLKSFSLEPAIKINVFKDLYFNLGLNVAFLLKNDFSQIEKLTKPTNYGTFLNPDGSDSFSRERNKLSGEINDANSILLSPMASISVLLPLDDKGKLFLEPEAAFYYGLTNFVDNELVEKWKCNTLSLAVSLKYSPIKSLPKQEVNFEKFEIDTIKIEKDVIASTFSIGKEKFEFDLEENDQEIIKIRKTIRTDTMFVKKTYNISGNLIVVGVDNDGNETANPQFIVEEFISNRLDPLLNYIFFDDNSFQIPDRYKKLNQTNYKGFEIDSLYKETTLDIYYNLLNIIGKRMNDYPESKISLVGSNSDINLEKGNLTLSEKRAFAVKEYLTSTWNIAADRIKIEKRNLPAKPSIPKEDLDKMQENRRVEIVSDNYKILEPVFIQKVDRIANPPIVRFKIDVQSELPIKKWELISYQEKDKENTFRVFADSKLKNQIDWELSSNQKIIPKFEDLLKSKLKIEDEKSNIKEIFATDTKIEIKSISEKRKEIQSDYEIEKFSLILFDFDKSSIEGANRKIIDFISKRIKADSKVEIIGYTDNIGDDEYNKKLSEKRAEETKKALSLKSASTKGVGEEIMLFSNDLPEGRFYNRTINIIVKTLIK